ncbi:MAG: hypothetical protein JST22_09740 [Bacteroidetes bacterium]|nr:hypothetical protein [Bacteroidota bacterium]
MTHRWITSTAIILLAASAAWAQRLERQVITPAGGVAGIGRTHISWSAGQSATQAVRSDWMRITQGFQQPYFELGWLRAGSFSGNPGAHGDVAITLTSSSVIRAASMIRVRLRFNATLLEPVGSTPAGITQGDTIIDGKRLLDLVLPIPSGTLAPATLATLHFAVGLGNDSASAIDLLDASPVDGPLQLRRESGAFTLLGICREGGARLVNPVRRATMAFRPNPIVSMAEIEFDLFEECPVRVAVVDLFGNEVRVLTDSRLSAGTYTLSNDLSQIPSGSYAIVLSTPWQRIVRQAIVHH